jgi:hypothetical protein
MTALDAYFLRASILDKPGSINRASHSGAKMIVYWQ